jgi:hypothetical protein
LLASFLRQIPLTLQWINFYNLVWHIDVVYHATLLEMIIFSLNKGRATESFDLPRTSFIFCYYSMCMQLSQMLNLLTSLYRDFHFLCQIPLTLQWINFYNLLWYTDVVYHATLLEMIIFFLNEGRATESFSLSRTLYFVIIQCLWQLSQILNLLTSLYRDFHR